MREDRSKAMVIFGKHDYLLRFWNELTDTQRLELVEQFRAHEIAELDRAFKESAFTLSLNELEPIDMTHYVLAANIPEDTMNEYWHIGLEAISKGEVAAVVLAGGQATRLGATLPKGVLSLGLSGLNKTDSLFAIQAGRISRLQNLARMAFPDSQPKIWWIVMTSDVTRDETISHLEEVLPTVGLHWSQILVINQRTIPCFDRNGRMFLATKSSFVVCPDGNGGLFHVLADHFDFFAENGIKYFHVFNVDNVLCRVADPHFIGYCIKNNVDCAAKTVEKTDALERLGVVCQSPNGIQVVEYSELPLEYAMARDDSGRLKFRSGNIANYFFTLNFLETPDLQRLRYHRAFKKIPYIDHITGQETEPETENGYKLELFIFDAFQFAKNFHVWEVKRSEEFSPLKNAESIGKDCITTCRRDYYAECKRWLTKAGIQISTCCPVFIHPFYSYSGEGLENYREAGIMKDLLP